MSTGVFNQKIFNPRAFGHYIENVPDTKRAELIKSGALKPEGRFNDIFSSQTGTAYATIPFFGKIGGNVLNYDGETDIEANRTDTYEQSIVVIGRANAWIEDDFSQDITANVDFMGNVAKQVKDYFQDVDQNTLLAILKGVFSMSGMDNDLFVQKHTYDISSENGENAKIGATTLNSAIQNACGDNKSKFSLVIMHSAVATNLENMNLLNHLKYTDSNGVQRDLALATWNGRSVLIDDSMPMTIKNSETIYTTYILGDGAFSYADIGAKVPYEMDRDPKTNGGQTTLYTRQRKCFAPYGISYKKKVQATLSPTDEELANGENWALVANSDGSKFIDHKAIPIARIISKG